jgi:hypothetical protein
MITLRNNFATFSRRAEARVSLLKEIIERIRKGERLDVEGLLGTGDGKREKEWEEGICSRNTLEIWLNIISIVLQEIEREDEALDQSRIQKQRRFKNSENETTSVNSHALVAKEPGEYANNKTHVKNTAPSGFY